MTSEQFAYWLQGFVELNGGQMPTEGQWQCIQDHLKTVFLKITPSNFKPQEQRYCNKNEGIDKIPTAFDGVVPREFINFDLITKSC